MNCKQWHADGTIWGELRGAVSQIDDDMYHGLTIMRSDIESARELYKKLPHDEYSDHCQQEIADCELILTRAEKIARG